MSLPVLALLNHMGSVGNTSLVYHLAWMFSELGVRTLAVDLNPQAHLTAAFLEEETLVPLWSRPRQASTIYQSVAPLLDGGDLAPVQVQEITSNLMLVPGDLSLSHVENELSAMWIGALSDRNKARPFRILSAFWRSAQEAAHRSHAAVIVLDVGPSLGAINRAALLASSHLIVPMGADLFSLQGLKNLGPILRAWREGWAKRRDDWKPPEFEVPVGAMQPMGYITHRHGVALSRYMHVYRRWLDQIPEEYRRSILGQEKGEGAPIGVEQDENCLAMLKNHNILMPLAQEARKPIFLLRSADGAVGSYAGAVSSAYGDFQGLARDILRRMGVDVGVV